MTSRLMFVRNSWTYHQRAQLTLGQLSFLPLFFTHNLLSRALLYTLRSFYHLWCNTPCVVSLLRALTPRHSSYPLCWSPMKRLTIQKKLLSSFFILIILERTRFFLFCEQGVCYSLAGESSPVPGYRLRRIPATAAAPKRAIRTPAMRTLLSLSLFCSYSIYIQLLFYPSSHTVQETPFSSRSHTERVCVFYLKK